ncbi:hypothetical protein ASF52_21190 [Methylobacterium sp. Leaf112]|nr:hypothetical protein ASF52_21190 [Methylobacterium sp. Leaf112]
MAFRFDSKARTGAFQSFMGTVIFHTWTIRLIRRGVISTPSLMKSRRIQTGYSWILGQDCDETSMINVSILKFTPPLQLT